MQPQYTPQQIDLFWSKVNRTLGCWLWTRARVCGYGSVRINKRDRRAHRVAWELTYGAIPNGLWVLHRCDVPLCVRPSHLFLGDHAANMADMVAKGRSLRGERSFARSHPERLARGDQSGARLHPERLTRGDNHWTRQHPERVLRGDAHGLRQHPERAARGDANGVRLHPASLHRGTQQAQAKLTDADARYIREHYRPRRTPYRYFAERFSVSIQTVWRVVHGHTWSHVE